MLSVFRTLPNVYFTAYLFCRSLQSFLFSICFCSNVVMEWIPFVSSPLESWRLTGRSTVRRCKRGWIFPPFYASVWHVFVRWVNRFSHTKPKDGLWRSRECHTFQLCEPNEQLPCYPYTTQPYSKIRSRLLTYHLHGCVLKKTQNCLTLRDDYDFPQPVQNRQTFEQVKMKISGEPQKISMKELRFSLLFLVRQLVFCLEAVCMIK